MEVKLVAGVGGVMMTRVIEVWLAVGSAVAAGGICSGWYGCEGGRGIVRGGGVRGLRDLLDQQLCLGVYSGYCLE